MLLSYKNVYNKLKLFPFSNESEIYNFALMYISSLTTVQYIIDVTRLMEVLHKSIFHQV
jgi:hypothetical protein